MFHYWHQLGYDSDVAPEHVCELVLQGSAGNVLCAALYCSHLDC